MFDAIYPENLKIPYISMGKHKILKLQKHEYCERGLLTKINASRLKDPKSVAYTSKRHLPV